MAGPLNGHKKKEFAFGGPEFGYADMKVDDRIPLELLPLRLVPIYVRQV
ncbi:hypothetical protein [Albidovulum sp.]